MTLTGNPGIPDKPLGPGWPMFPYDSSNTQRHISISQRLTSFKRAWGCCSLNLCTCSPFEPTGPGNPTGPRIPWKRKIPKQQWCNAFSVFNGPWSPRVGPPLSERPTVFKHSIKSFKRLQSKKWLFCKHFVYVCSFYVNLLTALTFKPSSPGRPGGPMSPFSPWGDSQHVGGSLIWQYNVLYGLCFLQLHRIKFFLNCLFTPCTFGSRNQPMLRLSARSLSPIWWQLGRQWF